MKSRPKALADLTREHGVDRAPVLEEYTTPVTVEAMPSHEDDSLCSICTRNLSTECNDELQTEPAVITNCGHILGAHCLQRWANERGTCPLCRRVLCTEEQVLPLSVRGLYRNMQVLMTEIESWESSLDNLLAQERPDIEIHGQEFLNLVERLEDYSDQYHNGLMEIEHQIREEGRKKREAYELESRELESRELESRELESRELEA